MLRTNSTFNTYNDSNEHKPVVLININGFTNQYCTGTFSGIAGTDKKLVADVEILGGNVDLISFETSSFGIDFSIIDKDNIFFNEITSVNIIGKQLTIKIGFQEITSTNFLQLPICYITDMQISDDNITFKISARDKKHKEFKRKIFRSLSVTELTNDMAAGDPNCTVVNDDGFHAASSATWGRSTNTYIKIGNEICQYTGVGFDAFGITRAQLGTQATTHTKGDKVKELYYIQDNPIEFLIQILSGYNNTDAWPDIFDQALPTGFGLDFDVDDDLGIIQMLNEYYKWGKTPESPTWLYQWVVCEQYDADEFIREQILKILPGFFIYTSDSKLGLKIWDFRITNEGSLHGGLINNNKKCKLSLDEQCLITHIVAAEGYNGGTQEFNEIVSHYASDMTAAIGNRKLIQIQPKIINFPLSVHTDDELWLRYLRNSTHLQIFVEFDAFIKDWIYQIGDITTLTNSKLLDIGNGSVGWSAETIQLLEQRTLVNSNDMYCHFKGIAYDHLDEVGDTLDYEYVLEANIDDALLDFDALDSVLCQAADAYYVVQDYIVNSGNHLVGIIIRATLPTAGDTTDEYIILSIYAGEQQVATTNIHPGNHYNDKKRCYYNAAERGYVYWELYIYIPNSDYDIEEIKVDYYSRSAVGDNLLTDVRLVAVKILEHTLTLAETV